MADTSTLSLGSAPPPVLPRRRELLFGTLAPGATRTWSITARIPKEAASRSDIITLALAKILSSTEMFGTKTQSETPAAERSLTSRPE